MYPSPQTKIRKMRVGLLGIILVIFVAFTESVSALTIVDIEAHSYSGTYFVARDRGKYYSWSGLAAGPQLSIDYERTPDIDKQIGYYITKFSAKGTLEYSTRLPIDGILFRGGHFWISEDSYGLVFLVNTLQEAVISDRFYGFDSLGTLVWSANTAVPAFCIPAGIFSEANGDVLYFAFQTGKFSLFRFDGNVRTEKEILNGYAFYETHNKLSLPSTKDWKVERLGKDKFLAVGFKSSKWDPIYIISFLVNDQGEILDSVSVHNANSNTTVINCNRDSIGTTNYYSRLDCFVMPDSSILFLYGTHPEWENQDWVEDYFMIYVAKFSKHGNLISFSERTPKVLPLKWLPKEYTIKGTSMRRGKVREYCDYSVDRNGNFYFEVRKYGPKKPEK